MSPAKPECDDCGACCRTLIVEISEADIVKEPRLIGNCKPFKIDAGMILVDEDDNPVDEVVPGHGAGAMLACGKSLPCPFHAGTNCAIHATRPEVCEAFEAGSPECQRARYYDDKPPLGGGEWPQDVDALAAFIGEDF